MHLAWRRFGVTLPRDAPDQAAATTDVPLGEERPGDLYFFARPGKPIHHVGIVTAPASGGCCTPATTTGRVVVEEPLPADRPRWSATHLVDRAGAPSARSSVGRDRVD